MVATKSTPPPGGVPSTPGEYLRLTGAELLAAHQHLEAARDLLQRWRCAVPDEAWNRRILPPEGGAS